MKLSTAEKKRIEATMRLIPGFDPWDLAGDAWFDHETAVRAINFFPERLRHVEGSARGEPFLLSGWQAAIVGNTFGWKRRDEDGRIVRRFRRVFIYIARGNGKTPLCAGIMLCSFELDNEPGAQNYLAAGSRGQAGFLFRNAKGFIEQDEGFCRDLSVYGGRAQGGLNSIVKNDDPLSSIKVIPAEAAGQHGGIPHVSIIDELHVQESRDFIDVFETAMSKKGRAQPMLLMCTTADFDRPSTCNEEYDYACKVRDNGGDINKPGFDPDYLPVIYEVGKDDDWRNEAVWIKANPNLDVSVQRESLRKLIRKLDDKPGAENEVKRLHFNLRTSQAVRIVPMDAWDTGGKLNDDSSLSLDLARLKGRRCFAGIDLSSTEDLSSLALVFPGDDQQIDVLSFSWCPQAKIDQRKRRKIPYDRWHQRGFIYATTGDQIDYQSIIKTIGELAGVYDIVQLSADKAGAVHLLQELESTHGEGWVCEVPQTMATLSVPFKELLRLIKLKKVHHGGNPVLRWAASNTSVFYRGKIPQGGKLEEFLDKVPIMPSKQTSADKIDPFAALVTAVAGMIGNPNAVTSNGPTLSFV